MTDLNLTDFYGRVARIQKARAKGYGFEAPGARGRSAYNQPKARRRAILGPVVFLLVCALLLKGAILHSVGAASYDARVASLQAGDGIERIGGWLMQSEPVTVFMSGAITAGLAKLM